MHVYRDQYAQLFKDGKGVVVIGISVDPDTALQSWERDDDFPFLFVSDTGGVVGRAYGAYTEKYKLDNRTLFVIGPDGKITHTMAPFREIDPQAYTELQAAVDSATR